MVPKCGMIGTVREKEVRQTLRKDRFGIDYGNWISARKSDFHIGHGTHFLSSVLWDEFVYGALWCRISSEHGWKPEGLCFSVPVS